MRVRCGCPLVVGDPHNLCHPLVSDTVFATLTKLGMCGLDKAMKRQRRARTMQSPQQPLLRITHA